MNGGLLWTMLVAPAALLAVWLFLNVSETQHDDYKVEKAQVQQDKAEFDKEFSLSLGGKADPVQEARVQEARANLANIKKEQTEREAKQTAERAKMQSEIKELFIDDQLKGKKP